MKTATAMKLLEGFAAWPVVTAWGSALRALFDPLFNPLFNGQAGLPAMRAVCNLAFMPAFIGGMSGMSGIGCMTGRQAMAAGATVAGGRRARRAL